MRGRTCSEHASCWRAVRLVRRCRAGVDAAEAYRAIGKLSASPEQSVPFLAARLKAQPTPDPRRIARLIADLDSDQFKVRQQATEELERLGPRAASALRKALQGQPT